MFYISIQSYFYQQYKIWPIKGSINVSIQLQWVVWRSAYERLLNTHRRAVGVFIVCEIIISPIEIWCVIRTFNEDMKHCIGALSVILLRLSPSVKKLRHLPTSRPDIITRNAHWTLWSRTLPRIFDSTGGAKMHECICIDIFPQDMQTSRQVFQAVMYWSRKFCNFRLQSCAMKTCGIF